MKRYVIFASDSSMTIIIIGVIFVVVIIHYSKKIEYLVYIGAINCKYCLCSIKMNLKISIYISILKIYARSWQSIVFFNMFQMIFESAIVKL